jgi:transcriptional regulator with GAF, ATPase, and Fis domain
MVGQSMKMRQIFGLIKKIAPLDVSVIIQGETGTGKELVARAIHELSGRTQGPMEVLDCGAIPPNLIESELFGHEKGAFTGAVAGRPGAFERAHGGTIFLDELGELRLDLQPKLLRVLENHEVRRVGGNDVIEVNCRVIAATNRDLMKEIQAGNFREDLYFRLSVVPITVPPLRERGDDVLRLAHHVLERHAQTSGRRAPVLDDDARAALQAYRWPGNVRELQNCLERAAILAEGGVIRARHLHLVEAVQPAPPPAAPASLDLTGTLADVVARAQADAERRKIAAVLADTAFDTHKAARSLDIPFRELVARMRALGLGTD